MEPPAAAACCPGACTANILCDVRKHLGTHNEGGEYLEHHKQCGGSTGLQCTNCPLISNAQACYFLNEHCEEIIQNFLGGTRKEEKQAVSSSVELKLNM